MLFLAKLFTLNCVLVGVASAKIGVIIGIIIVVAGIAIISSSSEMNSDDNPEIRVNSGDEIIITENIDSEAHDFYIDEEGRKVIVINVKDSLSIDD